MTARQSPEEFAALEASVDRLRATITDHKKARDVQAARRAKLDADLKLLAEKKTAFARLVQKQQTLVRERDADTAKAKNLDGLLALLGRRKLSITASRRLLVHTPISGNGLTEFR